MSYRLAAALLAMGLTACGTPASQGGATASRTSSSSPVRAFQACPQPVNAAFSVHVNAVGEGGEAGSIFCASASGVTDFNTRLLGTPMQSRQLLAADAHTLIEVDGSNVDGSNQVQVFDLSSGAGRILGSLSSLGV